MKNGWDRRDSELWTEIHQLPSYGLVAGDKDNPMLARKEVIALIEAQAEKRFALAHARGKKMTDNHGSIDRPRTHEDLQRLGIYRALQRIADLPKSCRDPTKGANWAVEIAREALADSETGQVRKGMTDELRKTLTHAYDTLGAHFRRYGFTEIEVLDRESAHSELYEALKEAESFVQEEFESRQAAMDPESGYEQAAANLLATIRAALAHARGEK
jgi:hypothetical protein